MKVLLLDTETNGLKRDKHFVLSIGALIYDTKRKEVVDKLYTVLDWTQVTDKITIEQYITEINGFTIEKIKEEGIHPSDAFDLLYDFMVENEVLRFHILDAFNLPFDYGILKSNALTINHKVFSLLNREHRHISNFVLFDSCHYDRMFHSGFNEDGTVIRHNMAAVGDRYEIEDNGMAHNALADVEYLLEIFKKQFAEIKASKRKINRAYEDEIQASYSMWKYAENQSFYAEEVKGINLNEE